MRNPYHSCASLPETVYCEMYASHLQTYVDPNLSAQAPFVMRRTKQSCASDVPSG